MVFERFVASILNKFLGRFIENLDTKQLSIGGKWEFHDLVLKRSILDDLGLPVQCVYGQIEHFTLKIPWTNLIKDFFVIEINGLYLIAAPNAQIKYDPEKESSKDYERKLAEIDKIEAAKKAAAEKDKPPGAPGFAEKLAMLALRNIQINVKNIHLRYEDSTTIPGEPFSYGITLADFEITSTDSNWNKAITYSNIVQIFKLVNLEALAVYWNSHADSYLNLRQKEFVAKLREQVATKNYLPTGYDYILGPINATTRIRMNQKPELDNPPFTMAYLHFNINMEKLYVGINKLQYRDLVKLLDAMSLQSRGIPYRKYRPNVPSYSGYAKDWWQFAITSVLEEDVRRRRRNWDWNHIKEHRDMCKQYKEIYRKKCQKTATASELDQMVECEKKLDLFNIVIIRQKIELETQRLLQYEQSNKRGWFNWMFESSAAREQRTGDKAAILRDFEQEMTSEEKDSLYKALDYQENAAPAIYPETYVDKTCVFHLGLLEMELKDTQRVMFTELKGVRLRYDSRIGANAMIALLKIDKVTTYGLEQDSYEPEIISHGFHATENVLLEVKYETNPLDKSCDQRLHIDAQPLKIIYDAKTMNRAFNIFNIPLGSDVNDITAAASSGLANVREMSATGMQHIIDMHAYLDLKIYLRGPFIVIPYGGRFTDNENSLIVHLGNFKIFSTERKKTKDLKKLHAEGASERVILQTMMGQSYDQFWLEMTGLQILMAQSTEDWKFCIKETKITPMHLLKPVNLKICYFQALITDDPRLPLSKVRGELKSLNFTVSDARIMLVTDLVSSIQWPQKESNAVLINKGSRASSNIKLSYWELQDKAVTTQFFLEEKTETKDQFVQFTTLDARFVLGEIAINLTHQENVESQISEVATFKVNSLKCDLIQQTFNTSISVKLGGVNFEQFRSIGNVNIISTPITDDGSGDQYLFIVRLHQVDKKSPEFRNKYKSCETNLELEFKKLSIQLHQEALLELINYGAEIQSNLDEIISNTAQQQDYRPATAADPKTFKTQISAISENVSFVGQLAKAEKKPTKKVSTVVETIKFRLAAELQELVIMFTSDKEQISNVSIGGLKTVIILKDPYTQVNALLKHITIVDLNPENIHKNILTVVGDQALNIRFVMYNLDKSETEKDNISIDLTSGGLRIIFLNWFLMRMMNFMDNFQKAEEKILEASQAAADAAKQNVQDAVENATKISLNIDIKAPVIIIPVESKSYNALILDLGRILLINSFLKLDVVTTDKKSPIIDDLKMSLNDFKLSRVGLSEISAPIGECNLIEPISLKFSIKRNLSTSWYKAIPDIDVIGKINLIQIKLTEIDYKMTMEILSKNLAEGKSTTPKTVSSKKSKETKTEINPETLSVFDEAKSSHLSEWQSKVNTFLRFTFLMDKFIINLNTGGIKDLVSGSPSSSPEEGLARFSLEFLSIKGRILSDNSITTSILLVNCLLDDVRKGREDKLTRLIYRTKSEEDEFHPSLVGTQISIVPKKSMIDITFQMKEDDMFADVRVFSFTIILSPSYLMKIASFFQTEKPPPQEFVKPTPDALKPIKADNQKPSQMTINLKVEKPDIILVEHMDSIETNALILNSEIVCKLRFSVDHQVISGTIKDLQLFTCCYNPEKRAETKSHVLFPVTISLAGSTPEGKGLHLELLMTDMHIRVSPSTIELLNNVSASLAADGNENKDEKENKNFSDIWNEKPFNDDDYWFLKPDYGIDVIETIESDTNIISSPSESFVRPLQELCLISMPVMIITIEAGIGNKTLPMLLLESSFKGTVKNWSSQMSVDASLSLQMGYFNSRLALWEPLIEPVEIIKNNKKTYIPWELKLEVSMGENDDIQSPSGGDIENDLQQAVMSIDISSENNLELTATKSCLEVLNNLATAFTNAISSSYVKRDEIEAPFKVINELGIAITLMINKSSFDLYNGENADNVVLENGSEVPLQLKMESGRVLHLIQSFGSTQNLCQDRYLFIKVENIEQELELPINRADKRYFTLNYRQNGNDNWGLICDIKVDEGITIITLRSILQIYNHFNVPIEIYYMTIRGNELASITTIESGNVFNIPIYAVYTPTNELFFTVSNYSVTTTPYIWKDLQTNLIVTKSLYCQPKNNLTDPFIIKVIGEMEQVYFESTSMHTMLSTCYNIHLRPNVTLRNCLPFEIVCCMETNTEENNVKPGDVQVMPNVEPGKSEIVIRLCGYLDKDWSCREVIPLEAQEFCVWSFSSYDSQEKRILDLGMHRVDNNGTIELELYCPFWMLNKTGLLISYRSSDDTMNIIHHPPDFKGPILFSFSAKNFFGKKKACIKVDNGEWSDKFSVDVAGSSGMIVCKNADRNIFQIGVHNQLTYNGLTKQVTFTPYYVIINNANYAIECQEFDRPADRWIKIQPKSCSALWPKSELDDKSLILKVFDTNEITPSFLYTESHTTLLKLNNKYGGISVDIQITEGGIYINLSDYETGTAPALIINHTKYTMNFWEKHSVQIKKIQSKHCLLYTWDNPSGDRVLVWEGGQKQELFNDLRRDDMGEYFVTKDYAIYWVSFLNGMQRVLLFTENKSIVENAQAAKLFEIIQREITISIHGIGLSLVNNQTKQEIMYIAIASSGVIWEYCRMSRKRYKQFSNKISTHLETAYQRYLLAASGSHSAEDSGRILIDNKYDVDFNTNLMVKPHKKKLRRTFQTGLWLNMKSSPSQFQLHAKINRLQIDNQIYDCVFPVILAPVPPPKSVAIDSGIKPFVEVSIVQLLLKNSPIKQYKYFKVLVQEFHIKVDVGFINALIDALQYKDSSEDEIKTQFLKDANLVNEELYAHVSSQSLQEQKSFYDLLHFSPLKIHISFSMAAGRSAGQTSHTPNFLNVLLQGLGVTLTDLQDVIFKLAYFERELTFLTQKQLINEAKSHYIGQTIKQLYVLVFGLDVLGNPYGLVVGIGKGVEDLFYEPFQGAIQGPGEFAEGLVLGVKSLLGHTVGGAAGAVSRITGAMGKGIAALTFDEEYQKRRRDQINKKPTTVQEGLARSGKGLVMGVVDGVTGVFTKPISGAKEEGVGGFFKGLGLGAVGLVTRPAAGVVDFASGTMDTVKTLAECKEDANRIRPPRFIPSDGVVKPYNRHEAEGNKLLFELDKGKYSTTDTYVAHFLIINSKEILLLTNKRICYIVKNDVFGGWQVDWSYRWEDLLMPVNVVPKGVSIPTSRSKSFLRSSDSGKLILINDSSLKEEICKKIESLRTRTT